MDPTAYPPPLSVSAEAISLIADISELVGRLDVGSDASRMPHLRKSNRIKTIQASLAIENNSMSLEQVTAILESKRVPGPPNELAEVKNAIDAYNHNVIARCDSTEFIVFMLRCLQEALREMSESNQKNTLLYPAEPCCHHPRAASAYRVVGKRCEENHPSAPRGGADGARGWCQGRTLDCECVMCISI